MGGGRQAKLAWHFFLKILTPNKFRLHYLKCFKAKEDAERISKIKLADIASGVTIFLKACLVLVSLSLRSYFDLPKAFSKV